MGYEIQYCDGCGEPQEPSRIGFCDECEAERKESLAVHAGPPKRQAHTNDIGCAIVDALDIIDTVEFRDWSVEDGALFDTCAGDEFIVDSSHGFSDLRITTPDGAQFRVVITRIN